MPVFFLISNVIPSFIISSFIIYRNRHTASMNFDNIFMILRKAGRKSFQAEKSPKSEAQKEKDGDSAPTLT